MTRPDDTGSRPSDVGAEMRRAVGALGHPGSTGEAAPDATSDGGADAVGGGRAGIDLRAEMRRALGVLDQAGTGGGTTSELSIDETLLLHSIGWEPVDLVSGVSLASVPMGVWNWGQGEIGSASVAHAVAFTTASGRIKEECARVRGRGVVGVHVSFEVHRHHIDVELVGTAVRPTGRDRASGDPFVSDLSGRDFALLKSAGWAPVGLAFGASFVYAPRRSAGTALAQKAQNVELTNYTEAMYAARESAMERMQHAALAMEGQGIVEVKVSEGPMSFAHHSVAFTAYGTVVKLESAAHRYVQPQVVLPLDDAVVEFEAESLRGG